MDILSYIWEVYSSLTCNLPVSVFSFLIRANLLLLCPIAAAYIGFHQGLRSQKIQAILMIIGVLIAISIPLYRVVLTPSIWRPWLTLILVLGCWYLPIAFSFLAHPHFGTQLKVIKYTRLIIAGLFLINLLFWK